MTESWRKDGRTSEQLFAEEIIQQRIAAIADEMAEDFRDRDPVLICILRGAYVFAADLQRELFKRGCNWRIEFMKVSSYDDNLEQSHEPKIELDLQKPVEGEDVIFIEDIIDTGHSLNALNRYVQIRGARSISNAVLLSKPSKRQVDVPVHYLGFEVEDWVDGYGLDTGQRQRGNPWIDRVITD